MLGDCHRRIERFLDVLVRVAGQGDALHEEHRPPSIRRYGTSAKPRRSIPRTRRKACFPRLRQIGSANVRAVLAQVESLEEEHV
jgi:hypothetical protein